jgi:hypothetical protein
VSHSGKARDRMFANGVGYFQVAVEAPIKQLISAKGGAERGNKSRQRAWHRSYQQQRAATLRICPGYGGHFKLPLNFSEGRESAKGISRAPSSPSLPHLAVRQNPGTLSLSPTFPRPDVRDVRWGLPPSTIMHSPVASHSNPKIPRKTKSQIDAVGPFFKRARPRN